LYIAQGVDLKGRLGDLLRNGLLAFVANDTFVILNPFIPEVLFREAVGFQPRWIGQDPASAGDMYTIPREYRVEFLRTAGPFRYITIANESRLVSYTLEYLRNEAGIKSIRRVLDVNVTVTGPPLAYNSTNQDLNVSGIYVPSGEKLLIFNVTGDLRKELGLTLNNRSTTLTAPIGYTRGDPPHYLFVPVRSDQAAGILLLSPGEDVVQAEFVIEDDGAEIATRPDSSPEGWVYVAVNFKGRSTQARVYRLDLKTLLPDGRFQVEMPERVVDLYYVDEASRVLILGESGNVYAVPAILRTYRRENPILFVHDVGPRHIALVGSFAGTKYGALSRDEVYGLYFDPAVGRLVVHQFIGYIVAPLPPGTYSSGLRYWLGTDNIGHDILTQLIYGSRLSLAVGLLSALLAVAIGTLVGMVAGYLGRTVDVVLMKIADIALVLPLLPFLLITLAIIGPSMYSIVLLIALLVWPGTARVMRAHTVYLKERPFVDAARVVGAGGFRIVARHLTPNLIPATLPLIAFLAAVAILTEAALSFLGLGDPGAISWGAMLSVVRSSGNLWAWWWLLPPGLAITSASLGFYLIGRAADGITKPRLRMY
jgi:peptide/nickel transport system permease protein